MDRRVNTCCVRQENDECDCERRAHDADKWLHGKRGDATTRPLLNRTPEISGLVGRRILTAASPVAVKSAALPLLALRVMIHLRCCLNPRTLDLDGKDESETGCL